MTKTTRYQRLLAMLVSIALLASCLSVVGITASAAEDTVWDFENETQQLSLNVEQPITPSTDYNHTTGGSKSAKVVATNAAGDTRAQMIIKDANGDNVTVAVNESVRVSFWIYVPEQPNFNNVLRLWLTAGTREGCYGANGVSKSVDKVYEDPNAGREKGIPANDWYRFSVVTDGAHAGELRLGICGDGNNETTFYIDDVTVERNAVFVGYPTGTAYTYRFDQNNGLYKNQNQGDFYTLNATEAATNQSVGDGANSQIVSTGSGRYGMQLSYTANAATTADEQRYPSFSLPNTYFKTGEWFNGRAPGQNIKLEKDATFKITVRYKVDDYVSPATLYATAFQPSPTTSYSGLNRGYSFSSNYANNAVLGRITATGEQEVSAVLTPKQNDAFIIFLKMDDDTNRAGTKLTITAVDIDPIAASTISFNSNGGSAVASITGAVGDPITYPAAPTRDGFNFVCWTLSNGDPAPTTFPMNNVTLVANWAADNIAEPGTIKFDTAGGTAIEDLVGQVGDPITYPAAPTREGYVFQGWLTATGEAAPTNFQPGITTLVARWQAENALVMDAENLTVGDRLDLNCNGDLTNTANTAEVVDTMNVTPSGSQSIHVSGNVYSRNRTQFLVKDNTGAQVVLETGKTYNLSFWYYIPTSERDYGIKYWFAACDNENSFAADDESFLTYRIEETDKTIDVPGKGVWKQVVIKITDNADAGKLRFGVCSSDASYGNRYNFYVDDIAVEELVPYTKDPETESFEDDMVGTELDLNTDNNTIIVSDEMNATENGSNSALVTSMTNVGGYRAQMMIKNGLGQQVMIERDKNYCVTFKYFIPEDQPDCYVNYWFAATDHETCFASSDQKNAAVLNERSQATGQTDAKGVWNEVTMNLFNPKCAGKLRMGIATNLASKVLIYIDEIKVTVLDIDTSLDPNATVYDFENYLPGTDMTNFVWGGGAISDKYNHTKGGKNSLMVKTLGDDGYDRSQMVLLNPATGDPYEFEVGKSYTISMWVYGPLEHGDLFGFNMWMSSTDELTPFVRGGKSKDNAEYDMMAWRLDALADMWSQVKVTLTIQNGKYLVMGMTNHDGGAKNYDSEFYIDDIEIQLPKYMTVKFDTNGSKDTIDPIRATVGVPIPYDAVDPYLEGYEFTGWYTSKDCNPKSFFDIANEELVGKDGDVLTLYAGWKRWAFTYSTDDDVKPLEDKYELVYTEEPVWVDREPEVLDLGNAPEAELEVLVDTPEEDPPQNDDNKEALPTWLIIVIVIGAVLVVGGGATVALLLSKKKKTNEIDA